jgi:hypothetical protein
MAPWWLALAASALSLVAWPFPTSRGQQVTLDQLLDSVGRYVRDYERSFSAVVSQEHYVQRVLSPGAPGGRQLRSEVALVAVGDADWLMFRDVYEVDGRSVRDRQSRLETLFLKPTPELVQQARRIAEEGARYNIGDIARTLNTPTLALVFLRPENQDRSAFHLGGRSKIDGVETRELRFQEAGTPRVILTRDDAAASGRVWTDPASGTVLRTELRIASAGATAAITVTYARQERPALWVPVQMNELYEVEGLGVAELGDVPVLDRVRTPSKARIEGRARYSDFRQFTVDAKMIIR